MRTFKGSNGTTFTFNSDFSGEVIVQTPLGRSTIPAEDLKELIAYNVVAPKRIREIEQGSADELLR